MIQFSGPVFSEIPFTFSSQVSGLADQDLPAMLVYRRNRWYPTAKYAKLSARTYQDVEPQLGIDWPEPKPVQQALAETHLNWVNTAVQRRLDDATHVEIVGDMRFVEVLGLYGVVIHQPSRTVVHSYSLQVGGSTPARLVSDAQPVGLHPSPTDGQAVAPWLVPQDNWLHAIVQQLLGGFEGATHVRAFESDATLADMISHAIEKKVLGQICSRPWTVSIAKAFVSDIFINQCVRQMYYFCPANSLPASVVSSQMQERPELADYAYQLECRREVLLKLMNEQPNLLQPYLALLTCTDHGEHTEPVQWVQQQLRKLGCTPRIWRAILKSDRRLFFVPLTTFGHPLLALTWVIALIQRCETSGPVSPRFIKALAPYANWAKAERVRDSSGTVSYPGHIAAQRQCSEDGMVIAARPLWRDLSAQFDGHVDTVGVYPHKKSLVDIARVDQWLSSGTVNAAQLVGKKPWALLQRQADQTLRNNYSHLLTLPNWWMAEQPIEQLYSNLQVVPLVNAYELAVQGDRMRNCLRDCRVAVTPTMPMFLSAFRSGSDQSIAMVELMCGDGVWHLVQAAGPANRSLEQLLRRRIVRAAKHVASQMRRLPVENVQSMEEADRL